MSAHQPELSHETIYCAIYATPRGELRRELIRGRRKAHKERRLPGPGNDLIKGVGNRSTVAGRNLLLPRGDELADDPSGDSGNVVRDEVLAAVENLETR